MTDANGLVTTRTLTLGDLGHTESQDFGNVSIDNTVLNTGYDGTCPSCSLKDTKFKIAGNIQLQIK